MKTRPSGLTADAKQTISLGRGLVRSDVNAILFDEPLTVIDPHMKWHLRSKLKLLHRQLNHTMVYVTHDQTEALTFADKVVVMYGGQIVQMGTPEELFVKPGHTFVGYFIGSPGMNVMPIELQGTKAVLGDQTIDLPGAAKVNTGDRVELGVRPEYIRMDSKGLPVTVRKVEDVGRQKIVRAQLQGQDISVVIGEDESVPADAHINFDPKGINIYANDWRVELGA